MIQKLCFNIGSDEHTNIVETHDVIYQLNTCVFVYSKIYVIHRTCLRIYHHLIY